jgi:hypothetical protein
MWVTEPEDTAMARLERATIVDTPSLVSAANHAGFRTTPRDGDSLANRFWLNLRLKLARTRKLPTCRLLSMLPKAFGCILVEATTDRGTCAVGFMCSEFGTLMAVIATARADTKCQIRIFVVRGREFLVETPRDSNNSRRTTPVAMDRRRVRSSSPMRQSTQCNRPLAAVHPEISA